LVGFGIIQIPAPVASEFFGFISLIIVLGQVSEMPKPINLEYNIFNFLGKISYGIYVFHPIVIFFLSIFLKNIHVNVYLKYIIVYISVFSSTILIAYLSFTFYEKPFLQLKNKFSSILSTNSKV
jgi:peptidoglycan/LPS O-acetylase OafA/YrhL